MTNEVSKQPGLLVSLERDIDSSASEVRASAAWCACTAASGPAPATCWVNWH